MRIKEREINLLKSLNMLQYVFNLNIIIKNRKLVLNKNNSLINLNRI